MGTDRRTTLITGSVALHGLPVLRSARPKEDTTNVPPKKTVKSERPKPQASKSASNAVILNKVTDFAFAVFGDAAKNFGTLVADQIGYWRMRNLVRISEKWREELGRRGLHESKLKHLSFSEAYRITDAASLEENDEIQEMWAHLIASLNDPAAQIDLKKYLIDILKSIEPPDAALLIVLHAWRGPWTVSGDQQKDNDEHKRRVDKIVALREKYWMRFDMKTREAAIMNLFRLQCIQHAEFGHIIIGDRDKGKGSRYTLFKATDDNIGKTVEDLVWLVDFIQAQMHQLYERVDAPNRRALAVLGALEEKRGIKFAIDNKERSVFRLTQLGADLAEICFGREVNFDRLL